MNCECGIGSMTFSIHYILNSQLASGSAAQVERRREVVDFPHGYSLAAVFIGRSPENLKPARRLGR